MNYIVNDIAAIVASLREGNTLNYGTQPGQKLLYGPSLDDTLLYSVDNIPPYFMAGHRMEISKRLLEKDKDKIYKYHKYPLVALPMDIEETFEEGMVKYRLSLLLVDFTKRNINAEERYLDGEPFKETLYPLYESLLEAIAESGLFQWEGDQEVPPHTKIDRPFWGEEYREGNVKYIFNDDLDAIEIKNLRINRVKTC